MLNEDVVTSISIVDEGFSTGRLYASQIIPVSSWSGIYDSMVRMLADSSSAEWDRYLDKSGNCSWGSILDLRTIHMGAGPIHEIHQWLTDYSNRLGEFLVVVKDEVRRKEYLSLYGVRETEVITIASLIERLKLHDNSIMELLYGLDTLVFDQASRNRHLHSDVFVELMYGRLRRTVTCIMVK